ncbi:MAG: ATP-binding cassette subfamily B multidrug efflux pump [Maribacter sp.]
MKYLAYLNKYIWRYKWRFLLGIVFVAVSNYFRVLQPRVIRSALDLVVENINLYRATDGFNVQQQVQDDLGWTLLIFGGVVLLLALMMGIFMFFMRQTIIVMSRLIEYDLRNDIFAHYEKLSLAFYKKNNTGDLMARISEDVSKIRMYLGPAIMYGINLVSLFVLVIYSMLSVSVEMTLYCLIPLPILSISIYIVSNKINKKSEKIQAQLSTLNSTSQEVFSGIRVIKSYVQEIPMLRHFTAQSDEFKDKSMSLAKTEAMFHPLMMVLIGASTLIVIYVGGLQVAKGNITPGNIAEFVIYVNMLTWPVTAIGWVASIIQRAAASQKRINEFLEAKPDIISTNDEIIPIKGKIEFNRVAFTYPDTGIEALKDVHFTLEAGEKMAIIGKTGTGKTTIADLLLRMYDITSGEIKIDGRNIQDHNLSYLRERTGYVPQDVFLFSDTVSGNVAFGRPDATQADVEEYTRHAAVYEDIAGLPEGFNTIVGERGVTLSGGQKQRVSIARAFIKEPDIIILDDCLSAVDTTTEQKILGFLEGNLKDKTTIIITHRIYSLLDFDKIIVLEDGKVAEEGTHHELLEKGGFYSEMYEQQKPQEEGFVSQ